MKLINQATIKFSRIFLVCLEKKYLSRQDDHDYTFHSVILAGVNDIKNIKQKLIKDGKYTLSDGEGGYNSPWNIASKFNIDMSFNITEIASMLSEYETYHDIGMIGL